ECAVVEDADRNLVGRVRVDRQQAADMRLAHADGGGADGCVRGDMDHLDGADIGNAHGGLRGWCRRQPSLRRARRALTVVHPLSGRRRIRASARQPSATTCPKPRKSVDSITVSTPPGPARWSATRHSARRPGRASGEAMIPVYIAQSALDAQLVRDLL